MRGLALISLGEAIDTAQPGHEPSCKVYIEGYLTVAASAYCFHSVSPGDCKDCLHKTRTRLMDKVCAGSFGGQLEVGDCWVKYDATRFC
ncbi:unnamed protein product [Linum tenue]|uniref:Gnk2-homologous domain-containing protein n=1 Tax=Linum tenue TaxID=586396 RepID=A0AAV0L2G9_9ROSI|nr:unnamed protein product [Linum tenue]CAI0457914.1 unnamed protein product [Linum tenue]